MSLLSERSARVAAAVKLHRHVGRRRAARFLAEGPNLVEAALRRGVVSEVFATEDAAARFAPLLGDVDVELVTERAAKALSDTVTPVGLVAVCRMPEVSLDEVLAASPGLVAVAVETSEPGNAGTLIRLADAMGADAVVLAGNSVDPYNGKCLRASAGSIFGLPVVEAPDTAGLIDALHGAALTVLATTLDGEVSLDDAELSAPTAWLFGSEAHGLAPEVAALADARVTIPMAGSAESLNVAAAAAICLYQSARALRSAPSPRD
jgi:TrmH family RNA methyltransferase